MTDDRARVMWSNSTGTTSTGYTPVYHTFDDVVQTPTEVAKPEITYRGRLKDLYKAATGENPTNDRQFANFLYHVLIQWLAEQGMLDAWLDCVSSHLTSRRNGRDDELGNNRVFDDIDQAFYLASARGDAFVDRLGYVESWQKTRREWGRIVDQLRNEILY